MINRVLDKIEKSIYDIWLEAVETDKHITKEQIKYRLDILLQKKEDTANKLIPFCEKYIRQTSKSKNTIQNYRVALRHIKSFNPDLTFDDIDLDFFYKFREHMNGYKQNTVQSTIKNLKVFMQDSFDRGLHDNEAFRHKKFSVSKEEVDNIYLNEEELERLFKGKFNARLQKAVDLFLVLAWTGLRYSDLYKVDLKHMQNIDGHDCFVLKMQKTGSWITVPAHPIVMQILHKYDFVLPKLHDVKLNLYIKEAGALVEIRESHRITSHTGRRSMVCNLYLAGFPENTIMQITGHKKYSTFQSYINKLTRADHVKVASRFWQSNKGYLKAI